ncbi:helix-turn-helix domain-containing protein [Paracraurococcus ruber]|uniref:HTH araC/xylS-type domain-containing protein n=1 Tax=Paracraurococcus ruber TaxID=77675 RepID=A0ABS1CR13_9PROT|nr:AraC family transcriptional regulator [Paracraurococcus ruber]MBK1656788.1 hypothetical protein [Paracraurococcus ruber]TDG33607.1 AraC family transcriptional regulator [Paracraurococcus ruber]
MQTIAMTDTAAGGVPPALDVAQWLSAAAEGIRTDPAQLDAILAETGARLGALRRGLAQSRPGAPAGLLAWQVQRLRRMIEDRLQENLPVPAMAATVRLSRSHFCRAFAASFGCTPHAYLQARRIARAQALMLATRDPLAQIAIACGFADQAHLSRLFRRHLGCTPSAWRRSQDPAAPRSHAPLAPLPAAA